MAGHREIPVEEGMDWEDHQTNILPGHHPRDHRHENP
jgi:hypothetical protein